MRLSARLDAMASLALAASACSACDAIVGADTRAKTALKELESGFVVPVAGGRSLLVARATFREVAVFHDSGHWVATALVDADGTMAGQFPVGYIGVERIRFASDGGRWRAEAPVLTKAAGILDALQARHLAFSFRDVARYRARLVAAGFRERGLDKDAYLARLAADFAGRERLPPLEIAPFAWTVRADRDSAEVLEAFRLIEGGVEKTRGRARLTLAPEDGVWKFTSGLD